MKVNFVRDYRGYKKGEVHEFVSFITEDYLSRKLVEPYVENDKKDAEIADLKKQNATLKGKLTKQINAAPVNKQVTDADNK
ncbi:hypothetical protein LCGC14_1652530 [marine sediment metagenome]|uniref:DivIVA domain-containing protein n=1 Tax=marine sediment metagenome TaxID=412755 RepID=A0A0F9HWF0_9ZZZZ